MVAGEGPAAEPLLAEVPDAHLAPVFLPECTLPKDAFAYR